MQDLEKNMDDLFRKAVENYHVNPGESNWDKITPQLSEPASPATKKKINGKKYRGIALLLIFFMLGVGMLIKYTVYNNSTFELMQKTSQKNQSHNPNKELNNVEDKKTIDVKKTSTEKDFSSIQKSQQPANSFTFSEKNKLNDFATNNIYQNTEPQTTPLLIKKDDVTKDIAPINNQKILAHQKILSETVQIQLTQAEKKYLDTSTASSVNKTTEITLVQKHRGIYLGFLSGLSLNKVKNQRLRKPGFDIGITMGYQFNNKASVETGVFLSKKYYFTESKYFSMEKISASMPPDMKVMSIDGSSTLFEIPLKFKYNVCNKNKNTFFSSAGVSSYVLTKEKNNYHTMMNGTSEIVTGSYKNSSRYFAAAVNFSLGYEHTIGNHNNKIRIVPYVQIPLKGIGVGALPVMSAGLHVGFTLSPHQ